MVERVWWKEFGIEGYPQAVTASLSNAPVGIILLVLGDSPRVFTAEG